MQSLLYFVLSNNNNNFSSIEQALYAFHGKERYIETRITLVIA